MKKFQGFAPMAACGPGGLPGMWHVESGSLVSWWTWSWPLGVGLASPVLLPFAVPAPGSILGLALQFLWPGGLDSGLASQQVLVCPAE